MERGAPTDYSTPGLAPPPGSNSGPGIAPLPVMGSTDASPTIIYPAVFGPNPQTVTCPSCHTSAITEVKAEPSSKTHMMAAVLCMVCCLCCIPYCGDSCKNKNHYCRSCGAYLGTYAY